MRMNFVCMSQNHQDSSFTMEVDEEKLISFNDEYYGEYKYTECPMCGFRAKHIGYPSALAANTWQMDMNYGDRAKFFKDTIQPRRGGEASKEFIDTYPEQAKTIFTQKEMDQAKPVWKDQPGAKQLKY